MPSYAQLHVNEVGRITEEAWKRLMRGECDLHVYYRPKQLGVFAYGENPGPGWLLAHGEAIPTHLTKEQIGMWIARFAGQIPYLTD